MAPRPDVVPPLALHLIPNGCAHTYIAGPNSPVFAGSTTCYPGENLSSKLGNGDLSSLEAIDCGSSSGWGSDAGDASAGAEVIERIETTDTPHLEGDYKFRTLDGSCENILRLQESGQWWHSAHRSQQHLLLSKTSETGQTKQSCEPWEMAESLGTWYFARLARGDGMALLLTFESCRWTSDVKDHFYSRLRPLANERDELEMSISEGSVHLCYAVRTCRLTNRVTLELMSFHDFTMDAARRTPLWVRTTRAVVEMLGFRMMYGKGDPVNALVEKHEDEKVLSALPTAIDAEIPIMEYAIQAAEKGWEAVSSFLLGSPR